jgi:flavin reductase (DIM6/NTAB) family NADH-FMN oxidoreductase RutF
MIGISVGRRRGELKDTAANIQAMREFVVNIGDETMVEAIHRSALDFPPDVSEVEAIGLKVEPGDRVAVPRRW